MKKLILLFLTSAVILGISSCDEPPTKKRDHHQRKDRYYKDHYRGREDRQHEKRW